MYKNVLAVVLSLTAGFLVVFLIEEWSHRLYPVPKGYNFADEESIRELMRTIPKGALYMVILAHAMGSLFTGMIAALFATNKLRMAIIMGGVFMLLGVLNLFMIPHPIWFSIVDTLVYIPFAYFGARIVLALNKSGK